MSADVRRIVSEFGLGDDAQLASVRFTVAELERSKQTIHESLLDMMRIGHVDLGYDTRSNPVPLPWDSRRVEPAQRRHPVVTLSFPVEVARMR